MPFSPSSPHPCAVTILKEPIILLCLLLVAKGWGITRHSLERREICVAGSILALLYASVSVNMSLQTPASQVPMIIMYLAMLAEISSSVHANITILSSQLDALRNLEVLSDTTATPVFAKLRSFQVLAGCVGVYAAVDTRDGRQVACELTEGQVIQATTDASTFVKGREDMLHTQPSKMMCPN